MSGTWYQMEKVQSFCEITIHESNNEWRTIGFGWHTFYVRNNGFTATPEDLLKAADEHIKIELGNNFGVKSVKDQVYFGDASGPPGVPGVSGVSAGSRNDPYGVPPKEKLPGQFRDTKKLHHRSNAFKR